MRALTTEEWIARACQVHGDRYDYSRVKYTGSKNSVTIVCPIHGEFVQQAGVHTYTRSGCPKCAIESIPRGTLDIFEGKAKRVHGDRYDYSLSEYVNAVTKIKITCPLHGAFLQNPSSHLSGSGCPKCAIRARAKASTLEKFIEKANSVHNGRYGYEQTKYLNSRTKLEIDCRVHGTFRQLPSSHLRGEGCPHCAGVAKTTLGKFIEKANSVHNGRYDYGQSEYTNALTKLKITCHVHGAFEQTPNNHLRGHGCPKCAIENRRKRK